MNTDKPTIFISHSSKDIELARLIQQQLEICIEDSDVFASDIEPGENWFEKVMGKLKDAEVIIVLITPNSIAHSHWVWFELGYFWSRHESSLDDLKDRHRIYYPLHTGNVEFPNPVSDLQIQAASMLNKSELLKFFRNISNRFGSSTGKAEVDTIIEFASKLTTAKFPQSSKSLQEPTNESSFSDYKSPYDGYPDEDLQLLLSDYLKKEGQASRWHSSIFIGEIIVFEQFDREAKLPIGTSKRFLTTAMGLLGYQPKYETNNLASFESIPEDFPPLSTVDDIPF